MKKIKYNNWYFDNTKKIYSNVSNEDWKDWKWHLKNSISGIDNLNNLFPGLKFNDIKDVLKKYRFSITPYFLSNINFTSLDDPLLKQVIPDIKELKHDNVLKIDPFMEKKKSPVEHVIKRYPDRIVITVTNNCPCYCRYCTRKWMWEENILINENKINNIINYLSVNKEIREVIISGGEPFLISQDLLEKLLKNILSFEHIESVRIGTRILSFLPQRIDDKLIRMLSRYKPVWIITHFNHKNEITPETVKSIDKLISAGVVLCNQSVLLKGINDSSLILKELFTALQALRIKPYYLFQCDLVEGTSHFRTPLKKGLEIMSKLHGYIGGLCVPEFIVDLPEGGKVPILPEYITKINNNNIVFSNFEGKTVNYFDLS